MEEDKAPTTKATRGQELEDQEESVRIAVKALGDMRNMNSSPFLLIYFSCNMPIHVHSI